MSTRDASKPRGSEPKVPPMPATVHWFTRLIAEKIAEKKMSELRAMTVEELRALWDSFGKDSFCGEYDCADVHLVMNEKGDGAYCAV